MNEITPAEIIQWQNTIQEKGYSKTYERMIQNQLNALFNHAQRIYNLKENPCKKVKKMGKSDANKLEFWTKAEYDRFIAGIEQGSEDYLIFEILFWTGIREGELLALSLSDFDMSGNLLHINKTYNRIKKRDVIDTPKTENSVRTIDIPNFLKEEVQEYAKKYYGFPEDQRLFPIVVRTLQKRLKKYEVLTGVKPIRVHDIRHSHVAYLIYQGVEPLIIKERLGHKDIQMTLNTYGYLYPSQQKKVAEMLDNKSIKSYLMMLWRDTTLGKERIGRLQITMINPAGKTREVVPRSDFPDWKSRRCGCRNSRRRSGCKSTE